ncbi:FAD-binding monooxygenase moxY [Penicillium angulare]|uniref:FAD-binding monooxygenase moxY n=1 Tax=Penicillium angulare TaxID=116970 RepID=UPI002540D7D0|nr:FAD-binding monooxygenase moxY [Penicillium angulare]KAJ5289211.1 FAD-binding monooxygenase moxY [Penicillium angulare]
MIFIACIIEDPSTKRQYPRGYVEALEQRLAQLESTLEAAPTRERDLEPISSTQDPPEITHEITEMTPGQVSATSEYVLRGTHAIPDPQAKKMQI